MNTSTSTTIVANADPSKRRRRRARAKKHNNDDSHSSSRHPVSLVEMENRQHDTPSYRFLCCRSMNKCLFISAIISTILFIAYLIFFTWFTFTGYNYYYNQWVELDAKIVTPHFINTSCTRNLGDCDLLGNNCITQDYSCYQNRVDILLINLNDYPNQNTNTFMMFYFDDNINMAETYYENYSNNTGQIEKVFCSFSKIEEDGCYVGNPKTIGRKYREDYNWDSFQRPAEDFEFWTSTFCILFIFFLLLIIFLSGAMVAICSHGFCYYR